MKSPIFADEERIFQPDSSSSPTIGLNQSPFIFYERSRLFTAADALSGSLISCKYYSTCRLKCRRGHVYRRSIYQRQNHRQNPFLKISPKNEFARLWSVVHISWKVNVNYRFSVDLQRINSLQVELHFRCSILIPAHLSKQRITGLWTNTHHFL